MPSAACPVLQVDGEAAASRGLNTKAADPERIAGPAGSTLTTSGAEFGEQARPA